METWESRWLKSGRKKIYNDVKQHHFPRWTFIVWVNIFISWENVIYVNMWGVYYHLKINILKSQLQFLLAWIWVGRTYIERRVVVSNLDEDEEVLGPSRGGALG